MKHLKLFELNSQTYNNFYLKKVKKLGEELYGFDYSGYNDTQEIFNDASRFGHYEVVKLLLKDERVDPSDDDNYAIRRASQEGYLEVVKLLLKDSRVDPSADDNWAIRTASEYGHIEVVKLLSKDIRVQQSLNLSETELLKKYLN